MGRRKKSLAAKSWEKFKECLDDLFYAPIYFFQKLCFWIGFGVVSTLMLAVGLSVMFYYRLPDVADMSFYDLKNKTETHVRKSLEDKNKKYRWVSLKEVSRDYLYALVMSEDGQFFQHNGINYDSILNSVAVNIKKKSFAIGASTIRSAGHIKSFLNAK